MKCKECSRAKNCRDKEKPPDKCGRFERYEDSEKFRKFDQMMRGNKGINFINN